MTSIPTQRQARVAVLVDCDNVSPDILEFALRKAEEAGRLVIRRGYGNKDTLVQKWQESLTRLAFTPHLQFPYAPGKNTADIALALDTLEAHFDGRADTFFLLTSDSDFTYLCRKLRERGAAVCVVGEAKTPDALRNACDRFFEWTRPAAASVVPIEAAHQPAAAPKGSATPSAKSQPRMVVDAVSFLARSTPDGKVGLPTLGSYLRQSMPGFSSKAYGHPSLSKMLQSYPALETRIVPDGQSTVALVRKAPKAAA